MTYAEKVAYALEDASRVLAYHEDRVDKLRVQLALAEEDEANAQTAWSEILSKYRTCYNMEKKHEESQPDGR